MHTLPLFVHWQTVSIGSLSADATIAMLSAMAFTVIIPTASNNSILFKN